MTSSMLNSTVPPANRGKLGGNVVPCLKEGKLDISGQTPSSPFTFDFSNASHFTLNFYH